MSDPKYGSLATRRRQIASQMAFAGEQPSNVATELLPLGVTAQRSKGRAPESGSGALLPIVNDPFTQLDDEVAGDSVEAIALNFRECCAISRRLHQPLRRKAPDLRKIFKPFVPLTEAAKKALREADGIINQAKSPF